MNNNNNIKVIESLPLRGRVSLQSSPELTLVLITMLFLLDKKTRLYGNFSADVIKDFVSLLNQHGFRCYLDKEYIDVAGYEGIGESSFPSQINLSTAMLIILILAKRGYVNVSNDEELSSFYRYIGFVVDKKDSHTQITNKTEKTLDSITFHANNELYFYIALFSLYLNNTNYSISYPDLTYEQGLLIDLLKDFGLVTNVDYGEYTKVEFDFKDFKDRGVIDRLDTPNDPKDFIFYSTVAIVSGGEVEISGLDPKFFASSLKIYSQLNVGFESKGENILKIWGSRNVLTDSIALMDEVSSLDFTKVLLLPYLPLVNKGDSVSIKLTTDTSYYKSLLQDINRLGGELNFDKDVVVSRKHSNLKSGVLHMESGVMVATNYARLILAIATSSSVKEFNNLSYYNDSVIKNLNNLGARIDYE